MDLLLSIVLLVVGLAMLIVGGDLLVRGATDLARLLGVSELIIGLTVVAFGTSAPELAVNVLAAFEDKGEISFGNIIGSNIANIGLILGVAAMIRPLKIRGQVIRRELPMMLLATAGIIVTAADATLRADTPRFDLSDGLIMLLLFCVFMYYTVAEVFANLAADAIREESESFVAKAEADGPRGSLPLSVLMTAGGLALLAGGGHLTVDRAAHLALALGLPQVIVGLTLVAVGTSLPELVTSVIAARRGQSDLAVGNVVGSNIFNLLLILGVSALVRPIPVPAGGWLDLFWMAGLSVLLVPMVLTTRNRIMRYEGVILLSTYATYLGWRLILVINAK